MNAERTYDVTISFDDTRLTQAVHAEDMTEALYKAAGIVRRHKAAKQARRLHIERREA